MRKTYNKCSICTWQTKLWQIDYRFHWKDIKRDTLVEINRYPIIVLLLYASSILLIIQGFMVYAIQKLFSGRFSRYLCQEGKWYILLCLCDRSCLRRSCLLDIQCWSVIEKFIYLYVPAWVLWFWTEMHSDYASSFVCSFLKKGHGRCIFPNFLLDFKPWCHILYVRKLGVLSYV